MKTNIMASKRRRSKSEDAAFAQESIVSLLPPEDGNTISTLHNESWRTPMSDMENGEQRKESLDHNGKDVSLESHQKELTTDKDDNNDIFIHGLFSKKVEVIEQTIHGCFSKFNKPISKGTKIALLVLYFAYFAYCMQHRFGDEGSIVLLVITVCLVWKLLFRFLDSKGIDVALPESFHASLASKRGKRILKITRFLLYILVTSAIIVYLGLDVFPNNLQNLQSFFGMLVLIVFCFMISATPSRVNWHPVFWSFTIQFGVATLTLRTEIGYMLFKWLGDQVHALFAFSDAGSRFVVGKDFKEWGLALSVSGMIIFCNAFIFLMNHWGVIEFIVLKLGGFLAYCLETGPVESVVAAANIFIGMAEAPLLVRPYLRTVTRSELLTIMTCGFASISGGMMGMFIRLGAPANHLLTAAVISAPSALAFAKLIYPETERVALEGQKNIRMVDDTKKSNSLNSFSEGAVIGLSISASVWSNMLAFVSLLSLLDTLIGWLGQRAGVDGLTFDMICGFVLFPIAYAMGVRTEDCKRIGSLIGVKLFATPVVAYTQLGNLIKNRETFEEYTSIPNNTWYWQGEDIFLENSNTTLLDGVISVRSEVIGTYALCGFSAFTAIGICLGALSPLCPPRKKDILDLIIRAFIAGNMASFATGAVAGVLYSRD